MKGVSRMSLNEQSELKTPEFWFIYIAKAHTGRYYTGITNNPARRIKKHNTGQGSQFARDQGPFELVYVSLPLPSKSDARKREIQLKGWSRVKKEKLISGEWI
jgi:predicted GIY-YIG superfamily endonuclease